MQAWLQWQSEVVAALSKELADCLQHLSLDDIDWASWRGFYLEGRTPQAAVNRALERDL